MWMIQVLLILLGAAGLFLLGRSMRANPTRVARAFRFGMEPHALAVKWVRFVGTAWMFLAVIGVPIAIIGVFIR